MNSSINNTLNERQGTYGDYAAVAGITQSLMRTIESGASYEQMSDVQKTSLFMIANKMARIVNGDPSYQDSWHDISGYATLVVNELKAPLIQTVPPTPQVILDAQPNIDIKKIETCNGEHLMSCEHKTEDGCVGCVKWGESK